MSNSNPSNSLAPDPLIAEACEMIGVSLREMYRLIKLGEVQGFILGGRRRVTIESLKRYRGVCIARGHQLLPLGHPGKRKRGRPTKQVYAAATIRAE